MTQGINANRIFHQNVVLSLDDVGLSGELRIPEKPNSIVMFIEGSEASGETNRFVARELNKFGHATLTFDLMTSEEETDEELLNRKSFGFHSEFLAHRVMEAYKWLRMNGDTEKLPIGLFCTGDGAEAGLIAASHLHRKIGALVIADAWIGLNPSILGQVKCPTLFITQASKLEESIQSCAVADRMMCEHHVEIITLDVSEACNKARVAELARNWLAWFLAKE